MNSTWIGVDLDGTLAEYNGWVSEEHIGHPIPAMAARVKLWISQGFDVRTIKTSWPKQPRNHHRPSSGRRKQELVSLDRFQAQ